MPANLAESAPADTIAFYERQGWQNYGEWFVKPLSEGVSPGGEPVRDDN